jgi:hypothetical protein
MPGDQGTDYLQIFDENGATKRLDARLALEALSVGPDGPAGDFSDIGGTSTVSNPDTLQGADYVDGADGQSTFETALADADPGQIIWLYGGALEIDSPALIIDEEVHIRGWNYPTIKLADNTLDSSDANTESGEANNDHVLDIRETASGGSLVGVEVDGNYENQADYTVGSRPFSHCVRAGGNDGNRLRNYTIRDVYAHDGIRSCFSLFLEDSLAWNLRAADSAHDHLLYLPGGLRSAVGNATLSGFSGKSPVAFGASGKAVEDVLVDTVSYSGAVQNPDGVDPTPQLIVRDDDTVRNLVLRRISLDTTNSTNFGPEAVFDSRATVHDLTLRGDLHANVIEINADAYLSGVTVDIPSATPLNQRAAFDVTADNARLEDVRLIETSGDAKLRGINFGSNVDRLEVDGLYLDIGRQWLEASATVTQFDLRDFNEVRSNGTNISGSVAYAIDGTATESADAEEPQLDYPVGTLVDFTDSGDGTGDGVFVIFDSGPVGL